MAETDTGLEAAKAKRDRSPPFPFISLKTTVEKLIAFESKFGRHPVPALKAGLAWGVKPESSQAAQILAALKAFGFVEYEGSNEKRTAALTEDARNYLRAQQDSIKAQILKTAAMRPRSISNYWERWGRDRPIDEICLDELVLKGGFTETAARTFLRVYDETMEFAGLTDSDTIGPVSDEEPLEQLKPAPAARTAVPVAPPAEPLVVAPVSGKPLPEKGAGMRQEVFALAEGDVTIQWPEKLSADSFMDFKDWLQLLERRIKRSVVEPTPTPRRRLDLGDDKETDEDA